MKTSTETEKSIAEEVDPRTKICSSCKQEKPLTDFQKHPSGKGGRQSRCRQCANARRWEKGRFRDEEDKQRIYAANRESYQRNRDKILRRHFEKKLAWKIEMTNLLGGACIDCGESHPVLLEFDHVDPEQKSFEVANAVNSSGKYPLNVLLAEIEKCELRCRNCHMLRHVSCELSLEDGMWLVGDRKPNGGSGKGGKSKERGEDFHAGK